MRKMGLNELREKFLSFFETKGHLRMPSFSLIPVNDPSLLLINSGMAPLKAYFTGKEVPPSKRVTTCQKCIRTPDIENVGITSRHGTFFEMLGNFSFGDYFKKEAIAWAWEFVTEVMEMPVDRLWVSIYEDDDEAFDIWVETGVSTDRIVRMGKEDNFWEHGTGPCGPCSEIYFDRGIERGCKNPDCAPGCECDRFIEFWNLVFTQFNKDEEGNYSRLANPNIDTGMGLERLACIMQDVDNLFLVDTVRNILNAVCEKAGVTYNEDEKKDISIRVITDHIRSTTMMVCDGVIPSNEGRGYVLRRLLRRAARHGKLLGIEDMFLAEIAEVVIRESADAYPELREKSDYIKKVIKVEEEKFNATLDQGLRVLEEYIDECKASGKNILEGHLVFKLHDTYGFPFDLTREIAAEHGISVDEKGYKEAMEDQRKRAREAIKDRASSWGADELPEGIDRNFKTEFVGYSEPACNAEIKYIIKDGKLIDSAAEGDMVTIILDRTPIYAESGGQVGDTGTIKSSGFEANVIDCKKTYDGKYLHIVEVVSGSATEGSEVEVYFDRMKRMDTARNHTATHLLHKALKNILGSHVNQAGSSVDAERLRFDFSHFQAMTAEEIKKVENEVNEIIYADLPVACREMDIEEAKKQGAVALFGEKYDKIVRVVSAGDYSIELCGGTHVTSTGQISFVKIISEGGIAAGVRRIEALTGRHALEYLNNKEELLEKSAELLKTNTADIIKRIEQLNSELKAAQKEAADLKKKLVRGSLDEIVQEARDIKGVKVISARIDGLDAESLRETGDRLRSMLGDNSTVVLFSENEGRVGIVAMATKNAVSKGIHSGNIIREVAKMLGGGGGGRPDMAQAGGKDASKIQEAVEKVYEIVGTIG